MNDLQFTRFSTFMRAVSKVKSSQPEKLPFTPYFIFDPDLPSLTVKTRQSVIEHDAFFAMLEESKNCGLKGTLIRGEFVFYLEESE